jgi:hypothetical protein
MAGTIRRHLHSGTGKPLTRTLRRLPLRSVKKQVHQNRRFFLPVKQTLPPDAPSPDYHFHLLSFRLLIHFHFLSFRVLIYFLSFRVLRGILGVADASKIPRKTRNDNSSHSDNRIASVIGEFVFYRPLSLLPAADLSKMLHSCYDLPIASTSNLPGR